MMKTLDKDAIRHLVEEEDIEFIRLQFVDLSGGLKNIAVTRKQLDALLEGKISLDGAYYDSENASLRLVPDLSTFAIFPWRPQTGKVAGFMCDLYGSDGNPVETDSRNILKWIIEDIRVRFRSDLTISPKIEFFLFDMDENGRPAVTTDESAGLMDVSPLDTGENARRDIILTLEEMGFDIRASYHEKASGQHQIDLAGGNAMHAADEIGIFKMVSKIIAKRHGKHATFLPKPRVDVEGSGMHLLIRIPHGAGSKFEDSSSENGLSDFGMCFLSGIIDHLPAISAITNPLVNSYKRLSGDFKVPVYKGWSFDSDEAAVKVVKDAEGVMCLELCFPDATANPYLTLAVCLGAGVDGFLNKTEYAPYIPAAKKKLDRDELEALGIGRMPENLGEAIEALKKDEFVKNVIGKQIADRIIEERQSEWRDYLKSVSTWEIEKYLYRY